MKARLDAIRRARGIWDVEGEAQHEKPSTTKDTKEGPV